MAKVIVFSGACNSGKTTTIKAVAAKLRKQHYTVHILKELIREETDIPIDELRKDANAYMELQDKIIRKKVQQELEAFADSPYSIYLADRAATDSMFYLENYVDKSQLDEKHIQMFCELHAMLNYYLECNFWKYYCIVQFAPLNVNEQDIYRPKHIDILKKYEALCIKRLNRFYADYFTPKLSSHFVNVDLNCIEQDEAIRRIIKYI